MLVFISVFLFTVSFMLLLAFRKFLSFLAFLLLLPQLLFVMVVQFQRARGTQSQLDKSILSLTLFNIREIHLLALKILTILTVLIAASELTFALNDLLNLPPESYPILFVSTQICNSILLEETIVIGLGQFLFLNIHLRPLFGEY